MDIVTFELTGDSSQPIHLADSSSLDAITRQLPAGFYSTFRTFRGGTHALGLKAHLDRLYLPAAKLGLLPSAAPANLRRGIAALLKPFRPNEARLRIMLVCEETPGLIYVALEPLKPLPPEVYQQGVRVITTKVQRENPTLKSTSFIADSQHERESLAGHSAFEGLIVHNGRVLEGLTSNFFYVQEGKLCTAKRGVLNGVTRREVILAAHQLGGEVVYRSLKLDDVGKIQEAFLTSSSRGLVPIVEVDGVRIGPGGVGRLTGRLMRAYEQDIERRVEPIGSVS